MPIRVPPSRVSSADIAKDAPETTASLSSITALERGCTSGSLNGEKYA